MDNNLNGNQYNGNAQGDNNAQGNFTDPQQGGYNAQGNYNAQNNYNMQPANDPGHGFAIGSLVCGIVGLVAACCCTFLGAILGIVGIVLAFVSKSKSFDNKFEKLAMAGLIVSGVAIVFAIVNGILGLIMGAAGFMDYSSFM